MNAKPIEDAALMKLFEQVEQFRKTRSLSFFEFTTLAALLHFQQTSLDVVLLEVGLGGRLDAVNVVAPDVAVISSIGIDHKEWLGNSRESIAEEKAGIFRPNKPAICGDPNPPANLIHFAKKIHAPLFCIDKDFTYQMQSTTWHWQGPTTQYRDLPIPHLKCQNAASSLMAVEVLQSKLPVSEASLKKGLESASLPGRFQYFSRPVQGVLDVAHNPDSAKWLAHQLASVEVPGQRLAVIGMLEDKDIDKTIRPLLPYIDRWYVGGLSAGRSADPSKIISCLKLSGIENCYDFSTVAEAMTQAIHACDGNHDNRVVVFGSFHTVAEAQQVLLDWRD